MVETESTKIVEDYGVRNRPRDLQNVCPRQVCWFRYEVFDQNFKSGNGPELGSERCPGALDPTVVQLFSRRFRKSTREGPEFKNKFWKHVVFSWVPRTGWPGRLCLADTCFAFSGMFRLSHRTVSYLTSKPNSPHEMLVETFRVARL